MRSKKLISLLCAAALTVSSFAGLTLSASAADTVLYSNNFNGFTNNQMLLVARPGGDMPAVWVKAANDGNELFKALINEETPNSYTFTDADEATVEVKAGDSSPDDTGIVYAYEKEAGNTYISLPKSRFSNKTGGMKLDLSKLKAAEGEDFVVSFKAMLSAATDGETAAFSVGSYNGTVSLTSAALTANTWGDVRIVVSASGAATLYVNDTEQSSGTVDMTKGMTLWVDQYSAGTKKSDGIYARVNIDDLVVMSAAAGTGATVTVPAAKDSGGSTGPIVTAKEVAPLLAAPEGITPVVNQNFSQAASITSKTETTGDTSIDGLKVVLGDVDDNVSGAVTVEYADGDKVLRLTGGAKSTAGRGPVVSPVNALELAEGNSSVMTFAVNLSSTSSEGAGRLYILQSTRQAGDKQDGEYNAAMAVLATDDYSYTNGDTEVAINNLDADTWYKVGVVVSSDKYRIWVSKADEDWTTDPQISNDHVGQGESNLQVTALPSLAVTSSKAATSSGEAPSNLTYSVARIDNMLTYQGTADQPRYLLPKTEKAPVSVKASYDGKSDGTGTLTLTPTEPTTAVVIKVSPDNTEAKIVKEYTESALLADTAPLAVTDVTVGDKFFVWDSLASMKPLLAKPVVATQGAAATYKVSVVADATKGTVEASKTTGINKGEEVTITVNPAEGYELNKIEAKDALGADVTVTNGKFTMPESNVTVTVTFKAKSYNVTLGTMTNGTVEASPATAAKGDKVTLTVKPAEDYNYKAGSLKVMNGTTPVDTKAGTDANTFTFTMPAADVKVTAEFEAKTYAVTIAPTENGTVTADKTTAAKGDKVTLTVAPAAGYKLSALEVANGTEKLTTAKVDDTHYTFTMPAAAVTVTATFVAAAVEDPAITGTVAIEGTAKVGETLTANVTGLNDGKTAAYQWQVADTADGTYTDIAGETKKDFTLTDDQLGKFVKVVVTTEGAKGSIASDPTAAVAAKTYTVTGTVDAGVDTVVLHPATDTDHAGDIPGTIADTTVTFANVVAGTYTVTATAKTGYKDLTIKKGTEAVTSVTVTDANVTDAFAVTTTQKAKSAVTTSLLPADTTNGTLTVTGASDLTQVEEGTVLTIATTAKLGYNIAVEVKDSDNAAVTVENGKFTMPAKAVTVTATVSQKENTILSNDSTYISRNGKNETNENEVQTQVTTNYNNADTVLIGLNGNYNAMGLYKFAAPTIPNDKEIASAKLTFVVKEMNNKNGDSSLDVNYPNVSTGIDFSTITWYTMFTPTTLTDPKATPWQNLAEGAPFQNVTKLATVNIAKAETNVTHSDIDVTSYVKAQTKKAEDIVLVLNQCSRGANLEKVAMIEYTLQDKHYDVTKTDPAAAAGTITLPEITSVLPGTEVVFTVTPAAGKKVTAVKVNGETTGVTAGTDANTYKYTISAETPADINITAEFARADIATIEIAGDSPVARTTENVYTLTAKAADGTVLALTDDEKSSIAWSLDADAQGVVAASGTTAIAKDGEDATKATLTVDAAQAAGNVVVKVVIGDKSGTKTVEITDQKVYTITAATGLVGGAISVNKDKAIADTKITVTVTPDKGYKLTENSLKYNVGSADTPITATENVYSFNVPAATAETINVTAAFEKVDLAITNSNADADTNGNKIAVAATAQVADSVEVTVTEGEGYELATLTFKGTAAESEVTETAITKNAEGKYVFAMPAEAVTVTATFQKKAIADRLPASYDAASLATYISNAGQTLRDGDKSYTVATVADYGLSDGLKTIVPKTVTTSFDIKLAAAEAMDLQLNGASAGGNLGPTVKFVVADAAALSETSTGKEYKAALVADTWYNVSISATRNSGSTADIVLTLSTIDENDAVSTQVGTQAMGGRNIAGKAWTHVRVSAATGSPKLDNFYAYTAPYYAATVSVTDGADPIVGATVAVKKGDVTYATGTTDAAGAAAVSLQAGTYTVAVTKEGYTDVNDGSLTVEATGANTASVTLAAQSQDVASVAISGGIANHTVLTSSSDRVVANLTATALNSEGSALASQPTINWASSSTDTTVENGVVTVKNTQTTGEVTITATVADTSISTTYTITVAATGEETVLAATDDFEGETSIFTFANGAAIDTFKTTKVVKFGGTEGASATLTLDTPVVAETGKKVQVSFNPYNGWLSSGPDTTWTIKNSAGETVLSYNYTTGSCNVGSVTLAGVAQTVTPFNFQNNGKNGWGSFTETNYCSLVLTLNADGSATVDFLKNGTSSASYTVEAAATQLTAKDIKTAEFTNAAKNADRSGGFDNFTTKLIAE